MVQREGLVDKLHVSADGTGQVGHAGSALLAGVADRVGLTRALSEAMVSTRQRRSAHDPGVVLRDLAVMLADGGDCLADLGAQRDQADLFGDVASDATAFRVIDSVDERCLERLRAAVALARARAWKLGARPQRREGAEQAERTVIDIDATLIGAHSKRRAPRALSRRASAITPCSAIWTARARRPPASCERAKPARTPPPITSPCSTSRWSSSTSRHWKGRSWCAPTAPAQRTI